GRLAGDARRDRTGDDPGERQRRPWTEDAVRGQTRRPLERAYCLREPSIVEAGKRAGEVAELLQSERDGENRVSRHWPRAVGWELIDVAPEDPHHRVGQLRVELAELAPVLRPRRVDQGHSVVGDAPEQEHA